MVFTANVCLLMGNNVFQILTVHVEREIDSRFDDTKYKRRVYILALENVVLVANGSINLTAQTPITNCGIQEKCADTNQPDNIQNRNPNLKRVCTRQYMLWWGK